MKSFRYLLEKDNHKDIWVCESCKRAHNERILRGEWKLIGRCKNSEILCNKCDAGKNAAFEYLTC